MRIQTLPPIKQIYTDNFNFHAIQDSADKCYTSLIGERVALFVKKMVMVAKEAAQNQWSCSSHLKAHQFQQPPKIADSSVATWLEFVDEYLDETRVVSGDENFTLSSLGVLLVIHVNVLELWLYDEQRVWCKNCICHNGWMSCNTRRGQSVKSF